MNTPLESGSSGAQPSPGLALWRVTHSWQRAVRDALAPFDLTHVQCVLLSTLTDMRRTAPVTQRELADAAGTEVMMTSQVVRALEKKGLIQRGAHPSDKRAVALTPTAEGAKMAQRANAAVEVADAAYFGPLGQDAQHFLEHLQLLDGGPSRKGRGLTAGTERPAQSVEPVHGQKSQQSE